VPWNGHFCQAQQHQAPPVPTVQGCLFHGDIFPDGHIFVSSMCIDVRPPPPLPYCRLKATNLFFIDFSSSMSVIARAASLVAIVATNFPTQKRISGLMDYFCVLLVINGCPHARRDLYKCSSTEVVEPVELFECRPPAKEWLST
jgi:hypothetical protein